jgi:hypothetical protein
VIVDLYDGARDPLEVDPAMLVEPLVLDCDDRLLDGLRDVLGRDEDAAIVARQRGELLPVSIDDDRVLRVLVLLAVLERGEVLGDRHHHPEEP